MVPRLAGFDSVDVALQLMVQVGTGGLMGIACAGAAGFLLSPRHHRVVLQPLVGLASSSIGNEHEHLLVVKTGEKSPCIEPRHHRLPRG